MSQNNDDVSAFYRAEKKRWVVKYKDLDGEWKQKTTPPEIRTERTAREWGGGWMADLRAKGVMPKKRDDKHGPTVNDLRQRWLKARREKQKRGDHGPEPMFSKATVDDNDWHLRVIAQTFGDTPFGAIDIPKLRAWIADVLIPAYAPNTCWNMFSDFRLFVDDAMAEGWIALPTNPLAHPAVLREMPERRLLTGKRPVFIELEHAQQLVASEEVPDHRRVRYLVNLCTGLSEGELAGRVWSDVDLGDQPTIEVLNALATRGAKGWATLQQTKNEHRVRKIPLHSAALRWWKKEGWAQYVSRAPKDGDPIFPGPQGGFSRPASAKLLRRDLLAAGCPEKCNGHPTTAQAMRRCFSTYLDAAGVREEVRGRLMGHARQNVTAKHYTADQIETDRPEVERIALCWSLVPGLVPAAPKSGVSIRATFGI